MIKEDLLYRKFLSADFVSLDKEEELLPVRVKNYLNPQNQYFDFNEKKWLPLDSHSKPQGYSVEFVEYMYDFTDYLDESFKKKNIAYRLDSNTDFDDSQIEKYLELRKYKRIYKFNRENYFDSRHISKDYVKAKILTDSEKLTLKLIIYQFERDKKNVPDYESEVPQIKKSIIFFDMKNGEVKFDFVKNASDTNFDSESDSNPDHFSKRNFSFKMHYLNSLQEKLPYQFIEKAYERLLELAEKFTGVSFDNFLQKSESENVTLEQMYKITMLPFCPQLLKIIESTEVKKRPVIFHYKRSDSKIFKRFCKKYKIRNTKTLRKIFMERPSVILTFLRLKDAGFRDMNLYNKIITSKEYSIMINKLDAKSLACFCRFSIKKRGQKATMNTILRSHEDFHIFSDGLKMFSKYYKHLPKTLKDDILTDGFTEFNHNALASLAYQYENKNITFSYTQAEKKLEDDIEGYSFRLPESSYKLCDIGNALHNCVATYADSVKEKSSTIVYAVKDNEYKICIEVSGNEIIQERVDHNAKPEGQEKKVLEIWHSRHGLIEGK